jgi:hypothetical protein
VATAIPCSEAGHADQVLERAALHGLTSTRVAVEKSCVPAPAELNWNCTPPKASSARRTMSSTWERDVTSTAKLSACLPLAFTALAVSRAPSA